jgi:hypothetical protein
MEKNKRILVACGLVTALIVLCGGAIAILAKFPTVATPSQASTPETIVAMKKTTEPKPVATTAAKPPEIKPVPEQFSKDKVPSEALLRQLTTDTLLAMDQAIKTKDSKALQSKIAKNAPRPDFQNFNPDLSGVKDVAPTFAPPATIDKDGHLIVHGMYPAKPNRVTFEFRYVFEGSEWKLLSHNLSTSSNN